MVRRIRPRWIGLFGLRFDMVGNPFWFDMSREEYAQYRYERSLVRRATIRAYVALYRAGFVITSASRDEIGEF